MSLADDIKTILVADAGVGGVNTLLTGGIYTFGELGEHGINRRDNPSAFNGTLLKPCAVIKDRAQTPDNGIMNPDLQLVSYSQVVEIWLYNNRNAGYASLETVWNRIYGLLQGKPVGANKNIAYWARNPWSMKEPEIENAVFIRNEFEFRAMMTAS